mgnify:CR=1 FL=1
MKDHRPGLIADFEDGFTRTIFFEEPGPNGRPRLVIECYRLELDGPVLTHRSTHPAASGLVLAAGLQQKLKDQA